MNCDLGARRWPAAMSPRGSSTSRRRASRRVEDAGTDVLLVEARGAMRITKFWACASSLLSSEVQVKFTRPVTSELRTRALTSRSVISRSGGVCEAKLGRWRRVYRVQGDEAPGQKLQSRKDFCRPVAASQVTYD